MVSNRADDGRFGFNTQPPEGGWVIPPKNPIIASLVSTHSRPKAAGSGQKLRRHAQARFQHTAARRRLEIKIEFKLPEAVCFNTQPPEGGWRLRKWRKQSNLVSTHSRPKAAGTFTVWILGARASFNTQPPEGGWASVERLAPVHCAFQHTAARRRLGVRKI